MLSPVIETASIPDSSPQWGPPVLLKRCETSVEARRCRARLDRAGIPSFIHENQLVSDLTTVAQRQRSQFQVFVPEELIQPALDVLEAVELDALDAAEPIDDPSASLSTRSLVVAFIGVGLLFFIPVGFLVAIVPFVYSIRLAVNSLTTSIERSAGTAAKSLLALASSVGGLLVAAWLAFRLLAA